MAQSNRAIDSLQNVILFMPDDTAKIRKYNELITKCYGISNFKEGLKAARKSLVVAQQLQLKKETADAFNNIGLMHENLENKDSALANYFISLKTRGAEGSKKHIANTNSNIGNVYKSKGNYVDALKFHFLALHSREELNDSTGVGLSYNNIGLIYNAQSQYQDALLYFNKSLTISTAMNDKRKMAMTYNNLSTSLKHLMEYDKSISYIEKATELNKAFGNTTWLGRNYNNSGNLYKLKADEFNLNGDTLSARLYISKAMAAFNSALDIFKPNENREDIILVYNSVAELYVGQGRLNDAEAYFYKSISLVENVDNKKLQLDTYQAAARLYNTLARQHSAADSLKANWLKKSLMYLEKSIAIKDSLFNESNSKQIAEIKTKYETEKKDNEIVLLNKEKDVQKLSIAQHEAALLLSQLESENKVSEIEILNKTKDIQELQLTKTQQDLVTQLLATKAQSAQLELEKKDKALKDQQLSKEQLWRNILVVGSLLLALVGFLLFHRYTLNNKIKHQALLINQRKHISADLHDDVGSTLSSISIYSEAIKNKLNLNEPENVMELVNKIGDNARETISNLSDIVWSINPINDSGEKVFARMESFASSLLASKDVLLHFKSDDALNNIDYKMVAKQNIFLIFKEAINNTAKYANAKNVHVTIEQQKNQLVLEIRDDGIGFKTELQSQHLKIAELTGNGLKNMTNRTKELNGIIAITSSSKGTKIVVTLPIEQISVA